MAYFSSESTELRYRVFASFNFQILKQLLFKSLLLSTSWLVSIANDSSNTFITTMLRIHHSIVHKIRTTMMVALELTTFIHCRCVALFDGMAGVSDTDCFKLYQKV